MEFSLYDDVDCDGIELSESSSLTHLSIKTERRIDDAAPGLRLIVDEKHGLRGFALLNAALYSYPLTSLSVKDICFFDQEYELNNQAYKRLSSLSHISIELYDDCDFAFGYCESGFYKILSTCKGLQSIDMIVDMACDDADIAYICNMIRTLAEATSLRELSYSVSPAWTMEQWEVVRGLQDHPLLFSPLLTLLGAEGLTDCTIFLRNSAPEPSKARKIEITAQTLLDLYRLTTNDKP